jgi:hypothetical protein
MELTLDIFKNDAFSVTSLQRVVDKSPYAPQALGSMGLFAPKPIGTEEVLLYEKDGGYALIPATERGSPWIQQIRRQGRLRALSTVALRKQDTLRAGELMGVANMALPENIRLRNAQEITVERTEQLKTDLEATKELHRLGALQGKLLDADGSTVLVDFFAEYGIAEPASVNFNFAGIAANGLALYIQRNIVDPILDTLKANGRFMPGIKIGGLVGDEFWYSLISHPDVQARWAAMEQTRQIALAINPLANLPTYDELEFGNVRFMHYQGSSQGDIDVGVNDAHFFPIGAKDVFNVYWSPGETLNDITELGKPEYLYIQPDVRTQMPSFVDFFVAAYPLYACIFPAALLKGVKTG